MSPALVWIMGCDACRRGSFGLWSSLMLMSPSRQRDLSPGGGGLSGGSATAGSDDLCSLLGGAVGGDSSGGQSGYKKGYKRGLQWGLVSLMGG